MEFLGCMSGIWARGECDAFPKMANLKKSKSGIENLTGIQTLYH